MHDLLHFAYGKELNARNGLVLATRNSDTDHVNQAAIELLQGEFCNIEEIRKPCKRKLNQDQLTEEMDKKKAPEKNLKVNNTNFIFKNNHF